jgi:hypothetical protein
MLPQLVNTIREARGAASAIIWMVSEDRLWQDRSIPVTRRYRLAGGKLMEVSEKR